jgi:hypothetical protein
LVEQAAPVISLTLVLCEVAVVATAATTVEAVEVAALTPVMVGEMAAAVDHAKLVVAVVLVLVVLAATAEQAAMAAVESWSQMVIRDLRAAAEPVVVVVQAVVGHQIQMPKVAVVAVVV